MKWRAAGIPLHAEVARTGFWICAAASAALYAWLLAVSDHFGQQTVGSERPILLVIGLLAAAFVVSWLALRFALRLSPDRNLVTTVFATALLFRVILLPSTPIQEIDIYRYLWDGCVGAAECCPYQFAPQRILNAVNEPELAADQHDPSLQKLAAIVAHDAQIKNIVDTIHYSELPSPYPPVSQFVFAKTSNFVPFGATAELRLFIFKCVLVAFDLATLGLVMALLSMAGQHPAWSLAYGWCPLVLKEFANSGHLDSIAIFFTTLALAIVSWGWQASAATRWQWVVTGSAAAALALGIGAKVYPVILVPLFILAWWRSGGWHQAVAGCVVLASMTTLMLWPMIAADDANPAVAQSILSTIDSPAEPLTPPPGGIHDRAAATDGLVEFFKRWEMNDFLFLLVVENLRPQEDVAAQFRPWFVIVPDTWSQPLVGAWSNLLATTMPRTKLSELRDDPFVAASLLVRTIIAAIFFALSVALARRATRMPRTTANLLRGAFLTLAWCWLLSPAQNPWYLCWALPLLSFARSRAWFVLPALATFYYLRFWLEYHHPDPGVFGTPYNGAYFFHFVVVWIEFLPWLVWLGVEAWRPVNRSALKD